MKLSEGERSLAGCSGRRIFVGRTGPMKIGQVTHWASVVKAVQLKSYVWCEVAFGKRAPGAGFQVALEAQRLLLALKFY